MKNYNEINVNGRSPIKMWTKGVPVEDDALIQLGWIAGLPIIHSHVAVMPDVHVGKGATVGSVIATKNAIIPSAVGVDIGCFTGDTLVRTLDGNSYTLKDLATRNEPFYVFACKPNEQKIIAAEARAFKTRVNASLVEIILDNGRTIRCTPEHLFLLRDGSWCEAQNLKEKVSLMPFNIYKDDEGYERVFQPYSGFTQVVHWVVARSGLLGEIPKVNSKDSADRIVIHHIDFMGEGKKRDNRPTNLRFMTASEHSKLHSQFGGWQNDNREFQQRRLEGIEKSKLDPVITERRRRNGRQNFEKYMQMRPDEFALVTKDAGIRGRDSLISWNKSEEGRASSRRRANQILECPICGKQIKGHVGMGTHMKYTHETTWKKAKTQEKVNHKVVSVRHLEQREDVYCLNVPNVHNFALDAGVFVHNCGMEAIKLDVKASQLPDNLKIVRTAIEEAVPHGFSSSNKGHVKGTWANDTLLTTSADRLWKNELQADYQNLMKKHKKLNSKDNVFLQLGTLGGGNHFIELCIDQEDNVWLMLHSGSRGIGNKIGTYFIEKAKDAMGERVRHLPNQELAYLQDNDSLFSDYWFALDWAQRYAAINRKIMLENVITAIGRHVPIFSKSRKLNKAISCHHNYASKEEHGGEWVYVTRKGAVSARSGELGIIPGSMGAKSYIVQGKGNPESFCSCSHGAGRRLSRGAAKRQFDTADLVEATKGVECRKDADIIDEIPAAYKNIDDVMAAQSDLVDIVATLKQVLCVKG